MRIVHIANFSVRPKQAFLHNTERKLTAGWIRLGHSVLNVCDRDVVRAFGFGARSIGERRLASHLVSLMDEAAPDFVAVGHAHSVSDETLAAMREARPQTRFAYWNVDAIFQDQVLEDLRGRRRSCDALFSTSGGPRLEGLAGEGKVVGFMPNPTDVGIESARAFETRQPHTDLFLATNSDKPGARNHFGAPVDFDALAAKLEAASPGFRFRHHVGKRDGHLVGGPLQDQLAGSRMGLNLSKKNDTPHYSSDRIAQLAGNGVLPLCPDETRLAEVLTPDGAEFYSSEDDLVERCARLAADDEALRSRARLVWSLYHDRFSAEKVADYLLRATFGDWNPADVDWPSLVS